MSWVKMPRKNNTEGVRLVQVDDDREGQRLDNFLSARLKGVPRSVIYRIIRTGQVRVNGSRCKPALRLQSGDQVRIPPARRRQTEDVVVTAAVVDQIGKAILFENDHVLCIDKPSGMAVHAGSGLPWGLIDAIRQLRPGAYVELAHRLDRETSGCLVLAKSGKSLAQLADQFRTGQVDKYYLCLLDGRMPQAKIEVDAPLARTREGAGRPVEVSEQGKPALTHFRELQVSGGCSYAEAQLFTGRTHQIRAHARHLGLPLAGDSLYQDRNACREWRRRGLKRVFLHAHRLALTDLAGDSLEFDSPLPADLRRVLDGLEKG
jgi:23S rRNA pseudouridine955/2504/2580 synthase